MTGIYVIMVQLDRPKEITVGKKYTLVFQKGSYAYVGSALAGLEKRLARHLSTRKKPHWHIDYLLNAAEVRTIICAETREKKECAMAQTLSQRLPSIHGFGCSDCNCKSHLFFSQDPKALKECLLDAVKHLNLNPLVTA
jgi:Uri superfamily endonuclease